MNDTNNDRTTIGQFRPPFVGSEPQRPERTLYDDLLEVPGLSATAADILEDLGYRLAIPSAEIGPLNQGMRIVGPAITLRYLPQRQGPIGAPARLAHFSAFECAERGDVLVIEGDEKVRYSVFGGLAAWNAHKEGLAACLVDGAVRDVEQLAQSGLGVWARGSTCLTGRGRLEGFSLNLPIKFAGVQVCPGDVALADDSGICFVPQEIFGKVRQRILKVHSQEVNLR